MIAAVWALIPACTHLHAESTEDKYTASAPLCSSHKLHTCAKASLDTKSSPSWHKIAALNPERLLAAGVAVCQQYDVQGWHPTCSSWGCWLPALITWLHIDFTARQHTSMTLRVTSAASFVLLSDMTWLCDVLGSAVSATWGYRCPYQMKTEATYK